MEIDLAINVLYTCIHVYMYACTLPTKGHSLVIFLTQVFLPEGRLEYSKIKTIIF